MTPLFSRPWKPGSRAPCVAWCITALGFFLSALSAAAQYCAAVDEDFDGDGRTDIGVYDAGSGNWYLLNSAESYWFKQMGFQGTVPITGDFDGDGETDIAVYYPPGGDWWFFRSADGYAYKQMGFAGTLPVTGDFDGDLKTDIGVYYPPTGDWWQYRSTEGYYHMQMGFAGTQPVTGDFDADGRTDIGVFHAPSGNWYLFQSTGGYRYHQFGFPGTLPVTGDFDGDGETDIGVYYPPGGDWYLRKSTDGVSYKQMGFAGTLPVTGDFDGDGMTDLGVHYRPGGDWWFFKSSEGYGYRQLGYAGTEPVLRPAFTSRPRSPGANTPRSFHLGFTPFPYAVSQQAVADVYAAMATDADIVAHHLDNGVPWVEALTNGTYHANVMNDWIGRKNSTPPGHKVYVAITPINIERTGLAWYRAEEDDMPLPPPWDTYAFNHEDVKTAFLNYAIRAVEFFDPDYLAFGIEVNLLLNASPEKWAGYVELQQYIYTELKLRYPELPVFVSFFGLSFLEGYRAEDDTPAHLQALAELIDYTDLFGLSLYPYLSKYLADSIPDDMYEELFSLSDKPIAIAETGYPGQTFSILNGLVVFNSNAQKQNAYITRLLYEADQRDFAFVINFVLRDYDDLYDYLCGIGLCEDLYLVWRDTGLYGGAGSARPSLRTWRCYLERPAFD